MATLTTDIFSTVPKEDYLSFFKDHYPQYSKVVQFLDFNREDVSKIVGIPLGSVRYDEKMPVDLEVHMREWATLLNLVAEHFEGDAQKTSIWFSMPNPLLGNVRPRDMIRSGRYIKLFKFVVNALAENKR